MRYQVEWTRRAIRDVRRLDGALLARITYSIQMFAESGRGDIKRLQGAEERYRLRVGDWRVIFSIRDGEIHVMEILNVLPRGEAYKH